MKIRKSIPVLVRFLTISLLYHQAVFSNENIFDVPVDASGCTVFFTQYWAENYIYSWNGQCKNGKTQGFGILGMVPNIKEKNDKKNSALWVGNWIEGRPSGLMVFAWAEEYDLNAIGGMVLLGLNPPGYLKTAQHFFKNNDGDGPSSRSSLEKSVVGMKTLNPIVVFKEIDVFLKNGKQTTASRVANLVAGKGNVNIAWPQIISSFEFLPVNNSTDDPTATGHSQRMSR